MQVKPKNYCPLLKKNCIEMECGWFMQIRGKHPQTGAEIDEWGCAVTWLPILMIENSQQTRQAGAAIESFRNEMVNANQQTLGALMNSAKLLNHE